MILVRFMLLSLFCFASENPEINVWLNQIVSPYNPFQSLPASKLFNCIIKFKDDYYPTSLFEDLEDLTFIDSGIHLNFLHNTSTQHFCRIILNNEKKLLLNDLIHSSSRVEMRINNLPFWIPIGTFNSSKNLSTISTQYDLKLYTQDQKLTKYLIHPKNPIIFTDLSKVDFWYSVNWEEIKKPTEIKQTSDFNIFKIEEMLKISTFINSFAIIALTFLVFIWIKQDVKAHLELDEESQSNSWIGLKSEAQRSPQFSTLFTSLVSTGCHLGVSLFVIVLMNYYFQFYEKSGMFAGSAFCIYFLLSSFSGFICGVELLKHKKKTNFWVLALNTASVNTLAFVLYVMKTVVNQHSMNFMHFVCILLCFSLLYTPLYLAGFYFGKVFSKNHIIRYSEDEFFIPQGTKGKKWLFSVFASLLVFVLMLPQVDSILKSRQNFVVFKNYDYFLVNLLIFITSNSVLSMLTTYLMLESHDARWHWNCFLTGSLIGAEIFLYFVYLLIFHFKTWNWVSFTYFLLCSGSLSLFVSLISGTISYISSSYLVKKIYSYTKKQ